MSFDAKVGFIFRLESDRLKQAWMGTIAEVMRQSDGSTDLWNDAGSKVNARIVTGKAVPFMPHDQKPSLADLKAEQQSFGLLSSKPLDVALAESDLAQGGVAGWARLQWIGWVTGLVPLLEAALERVPQEVELRDVHGMSGFLWACALGRERAVRWGVERRINVAQKNRFDWNASNLANANARPAILAALAEVGAPAAVSTADMFRSYGIAIKG